MADVLLTVYDANRANGVNVTDNDSAATSADTYYVPNNGSVRLIITNAAGPNNVTIVTPGTVDGLAIADRVTALLASKTYVLGPFPTTVYNDGQGRLGFTVSANADVIAVRG
jgi:hypothetical protein